jgi:transcription termination factor NusB
MTLPRAFVVIALTLSSACSAGTQKPAIETVMKNDEQRAEALEATLRVMDENPEYVDELFALALRHPATLERFLENHARNLTQDELARMTAEHLAAHPPGLKHVMIKNLDEISDDPAAMQAVAEAMLERSHVSAMVIAQKPEAVRALVTALIAEVRKNAKAREAFIQSLHDNREPVAELAIANPALLRSLMKAFAAQGAARGKEAVEDIVK